MSAIVSFCKLEVMGYQKLDKSWKNRIYLEKHYADALKFYDDSWGNLGDQIIYKESFLQYLQMLDLVNL